MIDRDRLVCSVRLNKPQLLLCQTLIKTQETMNRYSRKIGDIREGETRNFINMYKNGKRLSVGLPKPSNKNKKFYLKTDSGVEYISASEGRQLLGQTVGRLGGNQTRALHSSNSYGYCNNCGKELRGNRAKSHCTKCWRKGNR